MCQDCMDRFRAGWGIRPHRAEMVHHIIPLEERPDLALNIDNLRSLCNECHNKKHPEKGRQAAKGEPAQRHGMRVIKI
ncbi:MAG: HNH endonuclease [Clostridia bacterium]|nr:HNH endonuclease [Clostridia bacterium]